MAHTSPDFDLMPAVKDHLKRGVPVVSVPGTIDGETVLAAYPMRPRDEEGWGFLSDPDARVRAAFHIGMVGHAREHARADGIEPFGEKA